MIPDEIGKKVTKILSVANNESGTEKLVMYKRTTKNTEGMVNQWLAGAILNVI